MDRVYDYRDAKRLCASHQQILDTIQKMKTSHAKDSEKVKENATAVADSNVVSADIGFAVSSGKTNTQPQPNEIALVQSVYKYDIGQDIVTALDREKETIQAILA